MFETQHESNHQAPAGEETSLLTPVIGNLGQSGPENRPPNGKWRPTSKRVGIGPIRYAWWTSIYTVMEQINRSLAFDRNRRVSWDKWPPILGLLYLIAKIRFNRSNALTDPYDYETNDDDPPGKQPPEALNSIAADGKWVSDDINGQMGAAMTRFSSNIAPRSVPRNVDQIRPSARTVSKRLRWRQLDEDGEEIDQRALILNVMAQCWIQFQFHGFGGNTLHDPIDRVPYRIKRRPEENWPGDEAVVERTAQDPTRPSYDGRPTPINEKVHAWVQGQLYGNNVAEVTRLRSFVDGKLVLDQEGHLPEDPARPGIDLTGFNNNYSPFLSVLHWLFVKEHNAIAEYLKEFNPDWSDEELFQMARRTNCALIARIHTIEWTEDLLQHPTLQLAMHSDWYGIFGQRLKLYLMRLAYRSSLVDRLLAPLRRNDILWGMPGSAWEHHDGPFQVPKQFRLVYRLHEMVLSKNRTYDPDTDSLLAETNVLDFVHEKTRGHVKQFGYDALAWSFLRDSCGALQLHNFPRALTQFKRQHDGNLIDLAELDIFREREVATGSYNDLRRSLGEPPVESFVELTGGNEALAKELEVVYEGDVSKVDAGIGILAEPKPKGFALGFVQFYQFVLNAPRRVKSNRFLSEGYTYSEFGKGMDWVEHSGGFKGVISRHLPKVRQRLEGVRRAFAPWPVVETFPERLLEETQNNNFRSILGDLRTIFMLAATSITAYALGVPSKIISLPLMLALLCGLTVASLAIGFTRAVARRFLLNCERKCNTDKRHFMFGSLYRADDLIRSSGTSGKLWTLVAFATCLAGAIDAGRTSLWIGIA